jgi:hypothetical protein
VRRKRGQELRSFHSLNPWLPPSKIRRKREKESVEHTSAVLTGKGQVSLS